VGPEHELTVIANTADDDEFWGVLVCPDVDAVIYRLAGVFNEQAGYGVKDDTFQVLDSMDRIGEAAWFRIGDKDLATHLVRTGLLRRGCTLTEATRELCARFGVKVHVLPMSDDAVRTRFTTDAGELSFQEYFVRERLAPRLREIHFASIDKVQATSEVLAALGNAQLIVIGPSNPLISIAPILALVRKHLAPERTVAVTPIVAGVALKGPTVEMMRALGHQPSPVEVARMYRDIARAFVLDARDQDLSDAIREMGYRVLVADTVMRDGGRALAGVLLALRDV
jgi:LPPG:FO 2-phospho-L-lactate transferase